MLGDIQKRQERMQKLTETIKCELLKALQVIKKR